MTRRAKAPLARFLFSSADPVSVPAAAPGSVPVAAPGNGPAASPVQCNGSATSSPNTSRTITPLVEESSPLSTHNATSQPLPDEHIVDENIGVEHAEIGSAQTPNDNSTVAGSSHNVVEKMFIGVDVKNVLDFKPRPEAHLKMTEIVRSHYNGAWTSITKVPLITKDLWFEEFKKLFCWNITNYQMRKVFMHQAGSHIRSVFKSCRDRGTRPNFVSKQKWEEMEALRKTPSMVKQSTTNKKNKNCPNAINSGNFRGGARKLSVWKDVLEKKDGKKRKISDLVRQFWTKPDGTWTGSTPASYVEKFETLVMKENENNSEEIMTSIEEKKLWITACGGPKNKRIFALGEEGTALLRSGTISTSQPHDTEAFNEAFAQPFKDDIQELRATVVDLLKQQQEQQQKQAEFQTLILQHLSRLQANQN